MQINAMARGALLEALRVSRGLTQTQLALATGISQAVLSKAEGGKDELDEERWGRLAGALAVPSLAFSRPHQLAEVTRVFHRRQKSTPKSALTRIEAELNLGHLRVHSLLGDKAVPLKLVRRPIPDDGFTTPAEIAIETRWDLGVPAGPIKDLTAVLEAAGIVVMRADLDSLKVDAIAGWPDAGTPVVLMSDHAPAERQRFTMAHELGHAVMHGSTPTPQQEAQADAFAAEFLMPAAELNSEWRGADLRDLIELKKRWRVSLAAVVRRGWDLGRISDSEYKGLNIQLAVAGMHRKEPDPIPEEHPTLIKNAVRTAQQSGITHQDLAARALMLEQEFDETFLEPADG
jgi:Zn-dependent peptidase ImmA (M78 family)/transcriptional regulator with XRE-family HTH domain